MSEPLSQAGIQRRESPALRHFTLDYFEFFPDQHLCRIQAYTDFAITKVQGKVAKRETTDRIFQADIRMSVQTAAELAATIIEQLKKAGVEVKLA